MAAVHPNYGHDAAPVSPSATTTRGQNSSGSDESVSSKIQEVSQSQSTFSVESPQSPRAVSVAQQPEPRKIGRWFIGETLGKGGYSWVKKGKDEKNGKYVALKFVDRRKANGKVSTKRTEQMKTEITVMKNIKHPNIVRLYAYNMNTKYPERDDETPSRDVVLLVMEFMSGGELFDILYYTNALSEVLARTYFHQLMSGLEALHRRHINHRDLKPQNLLLDKRYNLKISDFGLSKIMTPKDDGLMRSFKVGTRGYQAPEIILNKPYTGACDVFACGVILFLLLAGYPPFQTASVEDRWYGNIARGKLKKFWKQHRGCGLTAYAIDLVTKMLAFDPNERITMEGIKKHPWFTQEVVKNSKELKKLIQLRHRQMEMKRANDPVKQQILVASDKFRSLKDKDDEKDESFQPRVWSEEDGVALYDVFTTHSASQVLEYTQEFSKAQFSFAPAIDKESCALVLRTAFQSELISAEDSMCEVLITVLKYKEYGCNLVKFVKMSGDHSLWRQTYKQLMVWLRPVLDGVPKEVAKELEMNSEEEQLMDKYFTSSKDAALLEEQRKKSVESDSGDSSNSSGGPMKASSGASPVEDKSKFVEQWVGDDFDYDVDY